MENFNYSYWEKQHFLKADLIIIGAGIVGLTAAIALKEMTPKLSILILERGFLPSGASTKNAGFACFGSISELIEQEQIIGADGLHKLIEKRWKGLLKLRNLLGDSALSFEHFGGYEMFKNDQNNLAIECVSKISHYNTLIADIVNSDSIFTVKNNLIADFGFKSIKTLIANQFEGQLNSGKMMKALNAKAGALGITILNSCNVNKLICENNVTLETDKGLLKCNRVLVCTNAFAKDLIPSLDVTPGRGQVIVTNKIRNLKVKGTFHHDKGYYYFRNIDGRLLIGGGRNLDFTAEQTPEFGETALVQNALIKLLTDVIIPETPFKIEHKWSGIMGFGKTLNPIVDQPAPLVFCAVRGNGMGVAIGSQTGQDAAELIFRAL